jgi:uncharacterized membrane protein YgaE (UPF0421/DUF939 family)
MTTLSELQADLAKYKAARDRILSSGQSFADATGRQISEGTLFRLENKINELENRIAMLQNSGKLSGYQPVFGGHGV